MVRVLILGGTSEASALAEALCGDQRFDATLSLAGVTQAPRRQPLPMRVGGFGGAEGLADWLRAHRIEALVDATHPFAERISRNAVQAARVAGVSLLRIARPAWTPSPGDRWTEVASMEQAAASLGAPPRRVLLTIGRKDLAPFQAHPQHDYVVRCVDAPPGELLPPRCTVLTARGPFSLADEQALFAHQAIEVLVTKNSGGPATAAKLVAARERGVAVVMLARPPEAAADAVPDWQSAWSRLQLLHQRSVTDLVV